jgi:hypothetical protein
MKKKRNVDNVDLDAVDVFVMPDDELRACKHVIQTLMAHEFAPPFNQVNLC